MGVDTATQHGIDAGDAVSLLWRPQTEAILDEVATEMLTAIRARGVKRLVIDGIDGFSKLTDEKSRVGSFLSALCNELRALGVTTLATAETDHAGITPGQPLAGMNQTGLSAVAGGIAEALVTTALGLLVAVPAVWAYNYFTNKVEAFDVEMDNSSMELINYFILRRGARK